MAENLLTDDRLCALNLPEILPDDLIKAVKVLLLARERHFSDVTFRIKDAVVTYGELTDKFKF